MSSTWGSTADFTVSAAPCPTRRLRIRAVGVFRAPGTAAPRPYDDAVPPHRPTVYLHVGPPKTGTTFLQDVLWRNRRLSRSRDLDLPGSHPIDHFQAALDLRAINFGGHQNPEVAGAWNRLVAKALRTDRGKVVISHEVLAGASVAEIGRAVRSFAPARVHVVYGARDLARQLPAVWQESLKNRRTRTYDAFLASALPPMQSAEESRGFWRSQDPVGTLQRWSTAVPPERISVVTLPQAGAPADTLWARFCAAIGLDPNGYDLQVARRNTSLTPADAEVLRRLNSVLPDDLSWPAYDHAVKRRFNARANSRQESTRLVVPEQYHAAVTERARQIRDSLASSGYSVCGDLDELLPAAGSFGELDAVPPDQVTDAAVELLGTVVTECAAARANDRKRRARSRAHAIRGQLRRARWGR